MFPGVSGKVFALTLWDPDASGPEPELLIVSGRFDLAGDVPVNNIAAWDGTQWQSMGGGMTAAYPFVGAVQALTVFKGELVAAGEFSSAGGVPADRIARWDGAQWHPLGDGLNNLVGALQVYDDELIAGGWFTMAGDTTAEKIARWDGTQWHSVGTGMSDAVAVLAVYRGELIAGGEFSFAEGATVNEIARWNGTRWFPLGEPVSGMSGGWPTVRALTVYNRELIVGGEFSGAGGGPANNIARWDGSQWRSLGTGVNNAVETLAVYNGELAAGGWFTTAGGAAAKYVARWDGAGWQALGSGVGGGDRYVYALQRFGAELIAGGGFTLAGGSASPYLARWGRGGVFGDADGDQSVTLADFRGWIMCSRGPAAADAAAASSAGCLCMFNTDGDADVDLADWAAFQNAFGR